MALLTTSSWTITKALAALPGSAGRHYHIELVGRAVKDVSRQSSVFSGSHSEEQPFRLVLPKL